MYFSDSSAATQKGNSVVVNAISSGSGVVYNALGDAKVANTQTNAYVYLPISQDTVQFSIKEYSGSKQYLSLSLDGSSSLSNYGPMNITINGQTFQATDQLYTSLTQDGTVSYTIKSLYSSVSGKIIVPAQRTGTATLSSTSGSSYIMKLSPIISGVASTITPSCKLSAPSSSAAGSITGNNQITLTGSGTLPYLYVQCPGDLSTYTLSTDFSGFYSPQLTFDATTQNAGVGLPFLKRQFGPGPGGPIGIIPIGVRSTTVVTYTGGYINLYYGEHTPFAGQPNFGQTISNVTINGPTSTYTAPSE